jgi:lipoprotein-releasing system permease protein
MDHRWQWTLALRHLRGTHSRPALRWINRFAFFGLLLGIVAWITVMSVMEGLQNDIKNKILREKPHLLWEDRPASGVGLKIDLALKVLGKQVRKTRLVLQTEGLLERETNHNVNPASAVIIQGIDGIPEGTAQLGIELASVLAISRPETLLLRSAWDLERTPLKVTFGGTVDTEVYEIDRSVIRVSRSSLAEWLRLEDAVSRVEIFLNDPFSTDTLKLAVEKETGLVFKTWKETDAALLYSLNLERNVMGFAVFVVILLSTLAVSMGMAVRVTEKRRMVGLLRALGAEGGKIRGVFLRETVLLSSIAVFLGILLSFVICQVISRWAPMPSFYYGKGIPVSWSWLRALVLGGTVMTLALLSAGWPLRRGLRVEPAEILSS